MSLRSVFNGLTSRTIILMMFVVGFFAVIIFSMYEANDLFNAVFPVLSTILFFMVKNVFDQYNNERNNKTELVH